MPPYDSTWFSPAAPLARVTLRNPANNATRQSVPMLLDTGADVTLIPREAAGPMGLTATPAQSYELVGFDGSITLAPVVQLELVLGRRAFRGQFLLVDQPWGIIGRNILNALSLYLDGPRLIWEERQLP